MNEQECLGRVFSAIQPQIARPVAAASNYVHRDDAMQVAREAVLKAIRTQDPSKASKTGGLEAYATVCARNSLYGLTSRASRRARLERSWETDSTPVDPASDALTPDDQLDVAETTRAARKFCQMLLQGLEGRERAVAALLAGPVLDDTAPSLEASAIASRLGITTNQASHSIHKVRLAATTLAESKFTQTLSRAIGEGLPAIHLSKGSRYHGDFVSRTIRQRELSIQPEAARLDLAAGLARTIVTYPWGCVLAIWTPDCVWTAVVEGTLRRNEGLVNGRGGFRKMLPITNYKSMAKALMNGQEFDMTKVKCDVMPACVGDYEVEATICDGDGTKRNPTCVSKDICIALQARMVKNDAPASKYVKLLKDPAGSEYAVPRNPEAFQERIEKALAAAGVKSPKADKSEKAKPEKAEAKPEKSKDKPAKDKPAKGKPKADKDLSKFDGVMELYNEIKEVLQESLVFTEDDAKPGQVLVKNRLSGSGYLAHYVAQEKGAGTPLFVAYFLPRSAEVRIAVPLAPGAYELSKAELRQLSAKPRANDGKFTSTITEIKDVERARFVGQMLVKLIANDNIKVASA